MSCACAPAASAPEAATPVFSTRLTRLFGVRHPIIAGGMMWLSRAPFVAAAARAGAMAFMTPKSYGTPAAFREGLAECIDLADGHPFGVNLSISRFRPNTLNHEFLTAALDAGITRFETAGSLPDGFIAPIHDRGGIVIHKSTQVRHAVKAAAAGCDAVTIVGMEAGGHPGINPHPAHVLLSEAVRRIEVPIALGGGIGTGRQILGALAMGADAAVVVTRFLVASEIEAHEGYKARLVAAGMNDSVTALASLKDTWRVLDNATAREVQRLEAAGARSHADFGELVRGQYTQEHAYTRGDVDKGMISLSPAVGHADKVEPVAAIIARLMDEAAAAQRALAASVLPHAPA